MEDTHGIREQEEVLSWWCRSRYIQEEQEKEFQKEQEQGAGDLEAEGPHHHPGEGEQQPFSLLLNHISSHFSGD